MDATTGKPLGEPWQGHSDGVLSVAFSPDGQRVVSGSEDDPNDQWDYMLLVWEMDDASWKARGCAIAGRNLTRAEWRRYLPERPYEKTCPEHPTHPSVIEDRIDQAANRWDTKEGEKHLAQAMNWIEEIPAREDRIALLWGKLTSLPEGHPMRPAMDKRIRQWIDQLPEANEQHWQNRMSEKDI